MYPKKVVKTLVFSNRDILNLVGLCIFDIPAHWHIHTTTAIIFSWPREIRSAACRVVPYIIARQGEIHITLH